MRAVIIGMFIFLVGRTVTLEPRTQLIVWNIGQGQWATISDERTCLHFDIGGEFAPWKDITRECRGKINEAYFSHWDQDHIGLAT